MKLKRMLERVEDFLSAKERDRRAQRAEMKRLLTKLKKKQRDLKEAVEESRDAATREALESKLMVLNAQRRKGVAALKALKKSR